MRAGWKKWMGILLVVLLGGVVVIRLFSSPISAATNHQILKTTILKVGKADAIIIEAPDATMVIDAGEEDDGPEVISYLRNRGIEKVDVLVITHYDKDHVGGADQLVEQIPVERILLPDYESTSTEYLDFVMAMETAGVTPEKLRQPVSFSLGDAEVLVEPPLSYDLVQVASHDSLIEIDNDLSLITTIVHGENRLVFTGDAEKIRLREWLSTSSALPCTFLKIPHHGVYNSEMENLAAQLTPKYTVICDSAKHPADTMTIDIFKKYNAAVAQTKDGNITIISNGVQLDVSQKMK